MNALGSDENHRGGGKSSRRCTGGPASRVASREGASSPELIDEHLPLRLLVVDLPDLRLTETLGNAHFT
jgi:hypothetical protein